MIYNYMHYLIFPIFILKQRYVVVDDCTFAYLFEKLKNIRDYTVLDIELENPIDKSNSSLAILDVDDTINV